MKQNYFLLNYRVKNQNNKNIKIWEMIFLVWMYRKLKLKIIKDSKQTMKLALFLILNNRTDLLLIYIKMSKKNVTETKTTLADS